VAFIVKLSGVGKTISVVFGGGAALTSGGGAGAGTRELLGACLWRRQFCCGRSGDNKVGWSN